VFITIDDGFTRSAAAAKTLDRLQWPVTAFVLPRPLAQDVAYFKNHGSYTEFANHTVNHPNLARLSERRQRAEICSARDRVTKLTKSMTTFFRPPGGSYNTATLRAAAACGITHLLMWRVTVWGDVVSTWGGGIKAGDVILLHYVKSLDESLLLLEKELARLDLEPALLSEYLTPQHTPSNASSTTTAPLGAPHSLMDLFR
jgi:peptidoglycan/xylan/chitin deacetylase (PgdA/CDA1 family)